MRSPPREAPARASLATGVMLITVATYLTYSVGLVSNAIIARGLAPVDFGRYAYVVWLCGWLVLIINNGLTTSGIRFVSELLGAGSVEAAQRTHGYLLRLSRFSEWLVLVGFAVVAFVVRPQEWRNAMPLFVGVVLVSAFAKSRYLFDISIAKGYGQFKVEAYSTVGVSVLTVLLVSALYMRHAQLGAYLLVFGVSSVAYLLLAAVQLRRIGIAPVAARPNVDVLARLRPHLQWTTLLVAVAIFGNKSIEVFFLNAVSGPTDVGFFIIGAALTRGGIDLLTSGLMTVLMPVMSNAFGRGGEVQVNQIFTDSVRYFGFAGLLAAGAGFYLAAPTVELLYGPGYTRAVPAFQVMVLVSGLTLGESAFGALLSTTDRQRSRAVLVVAQIVITVLFAAVLIPAYGFVGAIVAHAVSRMLGFALMFVWVSRMYSGKPPVRKLLRLLLSATLAAAAASGCVVLIPGLTGYLLAAVAYGLLLVPFSLLARCWTKADFALVARLLQRYAPSASRLHRWLMSLAARVGV
jgi:O-antigen/teichoic acid export membrane protein